MKKSIVSEIDITRNILSIGRNNQKTLILDPTICFERDRNEDQQIDLDKKAKHESVKNMTSSFIIFHIQFYDIQAILIDILKDSLQILQFHLFVNS